MEEVDAKSAVPKDLCPPTRQPDTLLVAGPVAARELAMGPMKACVECKQEMDSTEGAQCQSCGGRWRPTCIVAARPEGHCPWHCPPCWLFHRAAGTRDVTLDQPLMRYLGTGVVPQDDTKRLRVEGAASFVHLDEQGWVWL